MVSSLGLRAKPFGIALVLVGDRLVRGADLG